MRRRQFLGAGLASITATTFPARAATAIGAADLSGDIAILREAYQALHPGLLRYASAPEMAQRFDALAAAYARSQSLAERFLLLSRFTAGVRCGHSYANYYNQSDAVAGALFDGGARLPFHFRWLNRAMVVTAPHPSAPTLVPGTIILEIDGAPPAGLLDRMLPYTRADGGNDAKRVALLEARGYDRYETFDILHGLFAPARDSFALRVRYPDGREGTLDARGLTLAERRSMMVLDSDRESAAPVWQWRVADGGVAVLTMPDWALYNSKWDWRAWLNDRLTTLSSPAIKGMVIDLRGNEGGLDCGAAIVSRLIDADLRIDDEERRVRYVKTPAALDRYLDTWDKSFRDWGTDAIDLGTGFYRLKAADSGGIPPVAPRFARPVVVLTDAQNSSATFNFARLIQANRLGTLVGGATGGNLRGINGGAYFFVRLPASGMEVDLPLIGYFPKAPQPDRGLVPDIAVASAPADYAAGRDPVLDAALTHVTRTG